MKEEEEKNFGKKMPRSRTRSCHYKHGPCDVFGVFEGLAGQGQARPCHCRHGPCQAFGPRGFKFFRFSPHFWIFTFKIN